MAFLSWLGALVTTALVAASGGLFHLTRLPLPLAGNAPVTAWATHATTPAQTPVGVAVVQPKVQGVDNATYGYTVDLPPGWSARAADGGPVAQSAHLLLSGDGQVVSVQVCDGGLPCTHPSGNAVRGSRLNKDWALTGVPGTLYQYVLAGNQDDRVYQNHLIVRHGGHTYDISWTTPMAAAGMPGGHLLCTWVW